MMCHLIIGVLLECLVPKTHEIRLVRVVGCSKTSGVLVVQPHAGYNTFKINPDYCKQVKDR